MILIKTLSTYISVFILAKRSKTKYAQFLYVPKANPVYIPSCITFSYNNKLQRLSIYRSIKIRPGLNSEFRFLAPRSIYYVCINIPWIVKELDRKLAGVSVETNLIVVRDVMNVANVTYFAIYMPHSDINIKAQIGLVVYQTCLCHKEVFELNIFRLCFSNL